ncbi:protein kinase domain-containing protein [Aeromonas caviae]|uniref:protein kinase domain-containing protein n=1 Tax=Aeromonas caviae TaxID=648 RepID=UPI0021DFC5BD|nr:protein kinase [Aeromonas caviae]MCU9924595.1 protein kinase [Aeromonas caviae]
MNKINFHTLDEQHKKLMLEIALGNKGECISVSGGMCGDIYVFDQGKNVTPRYVCAKIPKPLANGSIEEANNRFVNELKNQLSYNHQMFVHWAFDFSEVLGTPVALFRYWSSDLEKLIQESEVSSNIEKLSILVYVCSGLSHCYRNGLVAHQDLKPANIFLRNVRNDFRDLPDVDIYNFALIADFGLANAYLDASVFDGSRPYMAPEQWDKSSLSSKTDVFALGVILYELMTGGFHPVGIKLRDYWPQPLEGNSKKWTKVDTWRKWAKNPSVVFEDTLQIEPNVQALIQRMLSVDPINRPSIDEVKASLLDIINNHSQESFSQLILLIDYFEKKASAEPLKESWPYLWEKWERFQKRFETHI